MAEKIDRRVKRTRRLVSNAFIELVLENGYDGVRIEDIIDRADVARTTFYTHFKDKGDLLDYVVELFRQESTQNIPNIELDSSGLPSSDQLCNTFQNVADHAPFFRMALAENGMPKFYDRIHQIVADMIETLTDKHVEETGRTYRMPNSLIAYHFAGAFLSTVKWWLEDNRIYLISPEEMADRFLRLHGYSSKAK
ncbi:MAG: TetR/AcrR family transcriptional regulator [Chloroflexota bacterium]